MNVNDLVLSAFLQAFSRYPEAHTVWIKISHRIGSQLPDSLLSYSIQKAGQLDLLVKCMEDEFSPDTTGAQPNLALQYQFLFSELWVGQAYEVFRLLKDRKCAPDNNDFESLAHDFRLLRIPLEKHEITGDKRLREELVMRRQPAKNADDIYVYSKTDPKRSHIMPTAISRRGSSMWQVTDISVNKSYWLERRNLSERFYAIFSEEEAEHS